MKWVSRVLRLLFWMKCVIFIHWISKHVFTSTSSEFPRFELHRFGRGTRTLIVMIVEKHVNVPVGFGFNYILILFLGAFQKRFSPYQSDFPKPRLGMIFASSGEFAAGKGNADCRQCQSGQYQDMTGQGTKSEFDHREMPISPHHNFRFWPWKGQWKMWSKLVRRLETTNWQSQAGTGKQCDKLRLWIFANLGVNPMIAHIYIIYIYTYIFAHAYP